MRGGSPPARARAGSASRTRARRERRADTPERCSIPPRRTSMTLPKKNTINVVTCLRYHDAAVAVDWLCRAFGFERQLVVPGEKEGTIAHAELRFGQGLVMLGTAGGHPGAYEEAMTTPREVGGKNTHSAYVIVEDPKTHHERARRGGRTDRGAARGEALRRERLHLPRPRGLRLELRELRPARELGPPPRSSPSCAAPCAGCRRCGSTRPRPACRCGRRCRSS